MERKELSYSVWLMPEGEIYKKLEAITNKLSQKYGTPIIRPHVTLLGGFTGNEDELREKTAGLTKQTAPFEVKLTKIHYFNEFFRALFILVERTSELMAAHETARKTFSMPQGDFLPHLSLIYGNFSVEEKERMIRETGRDFDITFTARNLHFVFNNERDKVWPEIAAFLLG